MRGSYWEIWIIFAESHMQYKKMHKYLFSAFGLFCVCLWTLAQSFALSFEEVKWTVCTRLYSTLKSWSDSKPSLLVIKANLNGLSLIFSLFMLKNFSHWLAHNFVTFTFSIVKFLGKTVPWHWKDDFSELPAWSNLKRFWWF